jgi:hypothetical protein
MKWIGQHIYDLVARFRNDVYLEDLSTTTETNVLVVDSDGKVSKTTVITGDVTGVTAGDNITVTDPTGPVPTVALSTNVDVAGTLDVTNLGTFDASITVAGDVGIGTASPLTKLHTDFGALANGDVNELVLQSKADGSTYYFNSAITGITFTNWFGGYTAGSLNRAAGIYGYNADTTERYGRFMGLSFYTSSLDAAATEKMRINQSGNVGIGTTTPAQKLDVVGNIAASGSIELGHASDTTITRVSAGRIAVEGVNVVTTSSTDTLTNKTLTTPRISSIVNPGTLTLPTSTDTLVGRNTTDTLTNKTLTAPTITGAGAIAGVFTGNITGNVTGNADTVTTNANLTGPVTSTGNTTAIASGAITTAMQKHLQTFEFNGFISSAASTNYFIPTTIFENKGPFLHNVDAGASGTTALLPTALFRSGGKVMPYAGTCKLWKGWVGVTGTAAFKVSIFKYTPTANDATPDSLVLVKEFSGTAAGNNNLIAIDLTTGFVSLSAGDILMTGISCASGVAAYFTSTLEVEWD